jgi:hypothetical protein
MMAEMQQIAYAIAAVFFAATLMLTFGRPRL